MLIEDVADRSQELIAGNKDRKVEIGNQDMARSDQPIKPVYDQTTVVCVPARDEADEIAASLLEQILARRAIPIKVLSCSSLAGECIEELKHAGAGVACVVVVPPFGQLNARYMCRRLRAQFQELKLISAILTERPS